MNRIRELIRLYRQYNDNKKQEGELLKKFQQEFSVYNTLADNDHKADEHFLYPCLYDKSETTAIEPIYFYQDAWAFERILLQKPVKHIDIGSHHKFISLLSKVTDLTMVDIRPLSLNMKSINFQKGDILNLPYENESIDSLSSLCVIEHIGLGRYGDKIDPLGSEKAFKEISRVLKKGSNFYMSVPVEENDKVYFNAHRAFDEKRLFENLLLNFEILDKKYICGTAFLSEKKAGFCIGCYHLTKK